MYRLAFSLLILFISVECSNVRRTPIIQTKSGPIQGAILTTVWNSVEYSSFKGIPYAAPPVGDLRFRAPISPKPWNQTRDAIEEASECPQAEGNDYSGNEDCLYLSVFTPQTSFNEKPKTLKPVMVWIYGGSFLRGSCNASVYGPDFFMEQDVIMVSFNYRLGALGFLYLDNSRVPGNAGLKDQLMALKWVRDNIAAFGGDPNRVTIFGQSAGSASVSYHVLSQKSKGLFHQAIGQSGTALSYLYKTHEEALVSAYSLATKLGSIAFNKDDLMDFYLRADPKDLAIAANSLPSILPFGPVKENSNSGDSIFLSECPINLVATGNYNKMPLIMGFTHDELLLFTEQPYDYINKTAKILKLLFPILPQNLKVPYEIVRHTSVDLSAVGMKAQIDFAQRFFERNNDHPIYYYLLSYVSNYAIHTLEDNIPVSGVSHEDDIGYLFNTEILNAPKDPNHSFNQFRRKFVTMWANFAKYGNPTPENANPLDGIIWQPSGKGGVMLNISDNFQMINRNQAIDQSAVIAENALYLTMPVTSNCDKIIYVDYSSVF